MSWSLLLLKYLLLQARTLLLDAYRHLCMHPSEFNDIHLKDLLENLSHENKTIVIMRDFNIDLLTSDAEKDSADFLDSM